MIVLLTIGEYDELDIVRVVEAPDGFDLAEALRAWTAGLKPSDELIEKHRARRRIPLPASQCMTDRALAELALYEAREELLAGWEEYVKGLPGVRVLDWQEVNREDLRRLLPGPYRSSEAIAEEERVLKLRQAPRR